MRAALTLLLCAAAACGGRRAVTPVDGGASPPDAARVDLPGDLWWPLPDHLVLLEVAAAPDAPRDKAVPPVPDGPLDATCKCELWIEKVALVAPFTFDVIVGTLCLPDGLTIALKVSALSAMPTAKITKGKAVFTGIKVPPGLPVVNLTPSAPGCSVKSWALAIPQLPWCTFIKPTDGSTLGAPPYQVDIEIQTTNASGGKVSLYNGTALQGTQVPDAFGKVTFSSTTLAVGINSLKAEVTVGTHQGACGAMVKVVKTGPNPGCALSLPSPAPVAIAGGGQGLGAKQDADAAKAGLQTSLEVGTDAAVDAVLLEELDSGTVWTALPSGGKASFVKITLPEGKRELRATCVETKSGLKGFSATQALLVDTKPPPAVSDLACKALPAGSGSVSCAWTSVGGAATYRVRYLANQTITAASFDSASAVSPDPTAAPAGATMTQLVSGLTAGSSYSFAIKGVDLVGNVSQLSNVPPAVKVN